MSACFIFVFAFCLQERQFTESYPPVSIPSSIHNLLPLYYITKFTEKVKPFLNLNSSA